MTLRIDMTDPVICVPKGAGPTAVALETQMINDGRGHPYICATITVCEEHRLMPSMLNISSEGLRMLARVANAVAEEIEVRNGKLEE